MPNIIIKINFEDEETKEEFLGHFWDGGGEQGLDGWEGTKLLVFSTGSERPHHIEGKVYNA